MQSGGHQIWGWLECAQDRQCYVVVTSLHKSLKISLLYWLVGHQFAQITPMWPFLSTSSSCMVGSSQEWFVTYKAFSCNRKNSSIHIQTYLSQVQCGTWPLWLLNSWPLAPLPSFHPSASVTGSCLIFPSSKPLHTAPLCSTNVGTEPQVHYVDLVALAMSAYLLFCSCFCLWMPQLFV
jgi:hypothetical protein